MIVFKNFWYLYFVVFADSRHKLFVNYNSARKYKNSISNYTTECSFYGFHLSRGLERFYSKLNCAVPYKVNSIKDEVVELAGEFNVKGGKYELSKVRKRNGDGEE